MSAIDRFTLRREDFHWIGQDLARPECVLAEDDGTLWVSDKRAALTRIDPDGTQARIGGQGAEPNGIAMYTDGTMVIANIGDGRIWSIDRTGHESVLLDAIDGQPLGDANFAYVDDRDRLWITISTRTRPRIAAVDTPTPDGYVALVENGQARVMVPGLCFANEIRIDADERWMTIVETAHSRILRAPLDAAGLPGTPEVFGPACLAPGARPDGCAFDAEGNLWVTDVGGHRLWVIDPQGRAHIVFEDPEGTFLTRPSSIAFAGPDRRTAVIGSLVLDRLATFEAPVAGAPMRHWQGR
jgi:sugar lactone lactonase YvrE